MKKLSFSLTVLAILFFSFNISTFSAESGHYCDPKTGICYPESENPWGKKDTGKFEPKDTPNKCTEKEHCAFINYCCNDDNLIKSLSLSNEQKKQYDQLKNELEKNVMTTQERIENNIEKINDFLSKTEPDFTLIEKLLEENSRHEFTINMLHLKWYKEFTNILTSEQKEKLVKYNTDKNLKLTCPVDGTSFYKGKEIYFFEYKSKKFYFCCKDCLDKFKENPEKYLK
ncbi:MAG: YHS domain-containing protein [bacterium]|nr:YHS domain-containing protein [bacterium]